MIKMKYLLIIILLALLWFLQGEPKPETPSFGGTPEVLPQGSVLQELSAPSGEEIMVF